MLTGPLIRASRELIGWSQDELGLRSGLSRNTIVASEKQASSVSLASRRAIRRALTKAGVILLDLNDGKGRRIVGAAVALPAEQASAISREEVEDGR